MPRRTQTVDALFIAHVSADNDLSPFADQIVNRLRRGTAVNPRVTAVALVDQLGEGNTRLHIFQAGEAFTPRRLAEMGPMELDMADPDILGRFLRRARRHFRAHQTVVSFIGHGTGPVPQCEWTPAVGDPTPGETVPGYPLTPQNHPLTPQNHPLTPQNHPLTPGDLSSWRTLSTPGWAQALRRATDDGRHPFDILFFDQCFQGNLDVLYELRDHAHVFIASPNYAFLRASYVKYLAALDPRQSAEAVASDFINIYQNTLTDDHPNAIFWIRGRDIDRIARAVSRLGQLLRTVVAAGDETAVRRIGHAVQQAQFVDSGRAQGQYDLGRGDELMGAGSFAANLRLAFPAGGDHDAVYEAADALLTCLQRVHATHRAGVPYVAPESVWAYRDGPTILAPRRREATNAHSEVWRASLYRPDNDFTAHWGPDPSQTVRVTQNLAFVHEGGWAGFIDAWYVNALTPTVGQPLFVALRSLVLAEDAATLDLTAVRDGATVSLAWSDSGLPYSYQVFKQLPGYRWQLLATVTGQAYTDAFAAATAAYRVAVFDDEDIGRAASAAVTA